MNGRSGAPSYHAVHIYTDQQTLHEVAAAFIARGLITAQPSLIVATPEQQHGILTDLRRRLIDVDRARRFGDLVCIDADDTLAGFMSEQVPNAAVFHQTIGGLVAQTAGGAARGVRVFGSMVDLLCERAEYDAAVTLEALWNDLARTHDFELLCGYAGERLAHDGYRERVCQAHTHVVHGDADVGTSVRVDAHVL